ncbi:MAG: MBL fold metallo-hydrolase [Ruminococcus sp.]|nr:MBL fold metallo-hydrolase [Ruminococcus sp.]
MARIYPLFSSSQGNSYFCGTPDGGVLIDAGVSLRRLKAALALNGIDFSAVKALFVTHEHSDHICALAQIKKHYPLHIFAKGQTAEFLSVNTDSEILDIKDGVSVSGFEVTSFSTEHDGVEPCGYRVKTPDGGIAAFCTDLGNITATVERGLAGCATVVLESNFDPLMLKQNQKYPYHLKQRIQSAHGHLSNKKSAACASTIIKSGTRHILLAHLSQENNTPLLAFSEHKAYLEENDIKIGRDVIINVLPPVCPKGFYPI